MAKFSDEKIKSVWESSQKVESVDPNEWRKDVCSAWINKGKFGTEEEYGWDIDHALPVTKGGTDHLSNLRAMHWQNNRSKADNFPSYDMVITSEANKNVLKKESRVVNNQTIDVLRELYPNNQHLQVIKKQAN